MYDEHMKDENGLSQDREIWKDWEGLCQVSSEGRIRDAEGKILRLASCGNGYQSVTLWHRNFKVHRIVAEAFIGKCPGRGYAIRHKNGNKSDNRAENLVYARKHNAIQVRCAETGEGFGSIKEAAERTGGTYSEIWKAVTGKQETAYGYHWERID